MCATDSEPQPLRFLQIIVGCLIVMLCLWEGCAG